MFQSSRLLLRHPSRLALAAGLLLSAAACSGGGGSTQAGVPGTTPEDGATGRLFVSDPNEGGEASRLFVRSFRWGRLVNVYTSDDKEIFRDFVIGENIQSENGIYELTTNPVTEEVRLVLLQVTEDDLDDDDFYQTHVAPLEEFVGFIQDHDIDDVTVFSVVPRNSALVLQFNDLLNASTVNAENIQVLTGYPPNQPFEARILADPSHGALADLNSDGTFGFYSTRVIIDPAVSAIEAEEADLPVNSLGLPASLVLGQANIAIRIPTKTDATIGQNTILRNASGAPVADQNNGTVDISTSTRDLVRALRSGGNSNVTGDVNNGFLSDFNRPSVIGSQPLVIQSVTNTGNGDDTFLIDYVYNFETCALRPKIQDVIQQGSLFGVVVGQNPMPAPSANGEVDGLLVRMVGSGDGSAPPFVSGGTADYLSPYDPVADAALAPCFVRFSPNVADPASPEVVTAAQVVVRFSEPMDPVSVGPFESMTLTRSQQVELSTGGEGYLPEHFVVGKIIPSPSLREFAFLPETPLFHLTGDSETYFFNLLAGDGGPTDLAGNPLQVDLPEVAFNVISSEPTQRNGGFVLRFGQVSEFNNEPDGNYPADDSELPEIRGQFLYDLIRGVINPRPVNRFAAVADRTQPVPSVMTAFPAGVQTPLSPLGSKLMTLWRYHDVGWGLLDETNHNVDIEGLAWSPTTGTIISDFYTEFEIRLAHSKRLPDEDIDIGSLFPLYPNSGLVKTYNDNLVDPLNDPQVIVHPRNLGYDVNSAELFPSPTGTLMAPYPLNRGLPVSEYRYYTWRDTSIQALGAPNGRGADTSILATVLNDGVTTGGVPYPPNEVPSIGLPLLMEFRCFPDGEGLGQNSFDISLAVNSSARPNFRAFSTGGVNNSGVTVVKNPDLQDQATGGFNPGSTPPGNGTAGVDNSFYIGQADIVIRVSRMHTIWFPALDADGNPLTTPRYVQPVIEPSEDLLPQGTQVVLAFRGAAQVTGDALLDANAIDFYGELTGTGAVSFTGNDTTWKDNMADINDARFFQTRITFLSNTETLLTATLSSVGFAFEE